MITVTELQLAEEIREAKEAAWEEGAAAQAACYGMEKDTGPNPYAVGARRLVNINGRMHDAMCDRDRCHPDCPERLLRRALRR